MDRFFSIIVPAYNVGKYIENTINSILNQDFKDFELIVINDGSTDETETVCKKLYEEYADFIVLLNCENRGVSAARNEGLKRASGEYVMFIDGDDYITPGALSYLHSILNKERPDLLCFDFIRTVNMRDTTDIDYALKSVYIKSEEAISWKLGEKTIPCCASCIRNELIKEHIITFDEDLTYVEDALFLFKCMLAGKSIMRNDNILYFYLQREGSATHLSFVPASVAGMEFKAWKRIKKLISYDLELLKLVNDRMKPIRKNYYRKKIKEKLLHV